MDRSALATLKHTPLYEAHLAAGARMAPFAGWELPLHYGSQLEEHRYTRQAVSLFDVSHMGQVGLRGPGALALAQALVTRDLAVLRDGESAYTVMCDERGGLVDDLIATRLDAENFLLVVNAATYESDVSFIQELAALHAKTSGTAPVWIEPQTERWAMIAVQGPLWIEVCRAALGPGPWEQLRPFRLARLNYKNREVLLSTTGYTGEPGAELLIPPDLAAPLWRDLLAGGAQPAGLAARDSLRLEKGYCLSGQDFTIDNNPFEAGLDWVVALEKPSFSGREALLRIKTEGVRRRLVGLHPGGGRIPRHGMPIVASESLPDEQIIGHVTSGGFAPSLGHPVALALIDAAHARLGGEVEIDLGRGRAPATIVNHTFYR